MDNLAGRNLKAYRTALGLSQAELAEHMEYRGFKNFYPSTIAKIEAGDRDLKMDEGLALADLLGIEPGAFLVARDEGELESSLSRIAALANQRVWKQWKVLAVEAKNFRDLAEECRQAAIAAREAGRPNTDVESALKTWRELSKSLADSRVLEILSYQPSEDERLAQMMNEPLNG